MKLVKGDTLSKLLSDRDDPTVDRGKLIGIFEHLCQTMAYAHSRGVIHRDLKPANFLLRNNPGVVSRGQVGAFLNGNPEPVIWLHVGRPNCAWSQDGKIIASTAGGSIELRLTSDVSEKRTLEKIKIATHGKVVTTIRFSPDGKTLATGGNDGTIDLWDVSELATAIERLEAQDWFVTKTVPGEVVKGSANQEDRIAAIFDPEKDEWFKVEGGNTWGETWHLCKGSFGSTVRLRLENQEGEQHEVTLRRQRRIWDQGLRSFSVAFAPNESELVLSDISLGATRLNLKTEDAMRYARGGQSVAYSPDGRLVAIDDMSSVSIRDIEKDKELYQWFHKGIPIEGATSFTLTLTTVAAANFGAYDVKVCPSG